jgi:hypothetical protein
MSPFRYQDTDVGHAGGSPPHPAPAGDGKRHGVGVRSVKVDRWAEILAKICCLENNQNK